MKSLLILSLILLVGCNAQSGGTPATTVASPNNTSTVPASTTNPNVHSDNNVQHIVFDVTNGNQSFYVSSNTFTDTQTFTIPSTISLDNNSTNSIVTFNPSSGINNDNYIDIELVGKISCTYLKTGNTFNFDHCTSFASSVYWTIQPGDVYTVADLNADSSVALAHKINVALYSLTNTPRNGHITFSYDL
jgi:hypothetical protein